ncbi:MAG: tail fiber domain-containing protein [Myxococcota bacterium]
MNAKIGDMGFGPSWAGFAHENSATKEGYALLQNANGQTTLINKKSGGGHIGIRVDNRDKIKINDDGDVDTVGTVTASNFRDVTAGDMGFPNWVGFAHADNANQQAYALLQSRDGQTTLLNKKPGPGKIAFRVGNVDKVTIGETGDLQATGTITASNYRDVTAGTMGFSGWVGFAHANNANQQAYALLQNQDGRTTLLNKKPGGGHIGFRVGNVDKMVVSDAGNVGIGVTGPTHPLQLASGAHVTAGGVFTNASSRVLKQNIRELASDAAAAALRVMNPVRFRYKSDPETSHVGFIAEDMPDMATNARRDAISPMDVVAILTRVVKDQAARLEAQGQRLADLEAAMAR